MVIVLNSGVVNMICFGFITVIMHIVYTQVNGKYIYITSLTIPIR